MTEADVAVRNGPGLAVRLSNHGLRVSISAARMDCACCWETWMSPRSGGHRRARTAAVVAVMAGVLGGGGAFASIEPLAHAHQSGSSGVRMYDDVCLVRDHAIDDVRLDVDDRLSVDDHVHDDDVIDGPADVDELTSTTTTTSTTVPPTSSSTTVVATTVPETTSSTTPPTVPYTTTSIVLPPPTTVMLSTTTAAPTSTVMHQGSTIPTTTIPTTTIPTTSSPLPFTGSDTAYPALFALGCVVAGGVLALRRRRAWS